MPLATAYVVIHAENGDVVGSYASRDEALNKLAEYVESSPSLQDELGMRVFSRGRPAGPWEPASTLLGDRIPQGHLI